MNTTSLHTDSTSSALSRACADSQQAAHTVRTLFLGDTMAYATHLIREILPTAAAITVDTEDCELHEVRDGMGKALWWAPASVNHVFNDSLVADVDDLLKQVMPFYDDLDAAGWTIAAKGDPYRDVQLPGSIKAERHSRSYVLYDGMVCHVHADLVPAERPSFTLVDVHGEPMPEVSDRVRAAIINSGYYWPDGELTVTLNGSDRPNSTADLAIACAILAVAGYLNPRSLKRAVLLGELGLDGKVRVTDDTREGVRRARICGYKQAVVATSAVTTSPFIPNGTVYGALTLRQAIDYLARPLDC